MRSAAVFAVILGITVLGLLLTGGGAVPQEVSLALWDWPLTVDRRQPATAEAQLWAAARALARREVVLAWPGGEQRFRLDELGVYLDAEGMARDAAAITNGSRLPPGRPIILARAAIDDAALEQTLQPLRASLSVAPVPASLVVEGDSVRIVPDLPGQQLDETALARALRRALAAGPPAASALAPDAVAAQPGSGGAPAPLRLELPLLPLRAAVTAESLAALSIRRRIATFTTAYDPSIPRAENVERSARALHGVILRPGDFFSYNATVGPVDSALGWQDAWVIVDGRLKRGVGGGICQTATTVYGAALRAGLTILERHPHALAVSYIEPSQDAAVAPGWQDLKLRNDQATAVLIQTAAGGGRVTVHIYGDAPPGREIRIESEILGNDPVPTEVVYDPSLAPGEAVVEAPGHPGIRSTAHRSVYQDGAAVQRQRLSVDVYPPTPRVVRRGSQG